MNGIEIAGWTLGKGRRTVKVTDPTAAYSLLADILPATEFAACCDVSLPQVAEKYAAIKNMPKKKARNEVEKILSEVISETVGSPALKKGGE